MAKHTYQDFSTLMTTFDIPVKSGCVINRDHRLEGHTNHDLTLFCGEDRYGRRFVHIPINVTHTDGSSMSTTILVYQVCLNQVYLNADENLFRVSANLGMDSCWDMLVRKDRYTSDLDLLNLTILLAGRRVVIYGGIPTTEGRFSIDEPSRYVELSLYTPE